MTLAAVTAAARIAWSWLAANRWAAALALPVALAAGAALWLRRHDAAVVTRHEQAVAAAAAPAREAAADARVSDAATNSANQRDLDHAIDTAPPGGSLSPAAHALACERLRQLGHVPAACRP